MSDGPSVTGGPSVSGSRCAAIELESPAATRRAGLAMGRTLPDRALVLFSGEMGSGKTTLIKAICEGLGIAPKTVISPTYTLVNIYPGPPPVYHVDLFRIEKPEAMLELDRDDWINPGGPTLIEWPEAALPLLEGESVLQVRMAHAGNDALRRTLEAEGGAALFAALFQALEREDAAQE